MMSEYDEARYNALLNFWYQVKIIRYDYLEVERREVTAGDSMEYIHRLIEEYEQYINPRAVICHGD